MIALVKGKLHHLDEDHVVVEANGVGYQVFCNLRTIGQLPVNSSEVELYIHTSVSDDAIRLYGFANRDELRLFKLLIGVDRVGPKAALTILGSTDFVTLTTAIARGDSTFMATIPGIGKKTAERLVLELRTKVTDHDLVGKPVAGGDFEMSQAMFNAITGLVGLGFNETQASQAVRQVIAEHKNITDVTEIIGKALRQLDMVGS